MENKIKELEEKLLRKEQECKVLEDTCNTLRLRFSEDTTRLSAELKEKEQECRDLKELNARLDSQRESYWIGYQKLEQECEELKKIINEAKNSKLDLKSFLVGEAVQNEYEEQLDQLKTELEQITALKDTYFACYHAKHEDLAKKYDQLKAENETLNQYKASKQASYEAIQAKCNELELKNRKLEAENEELKKNYFTVIQQRNKAEQTLDEIKEIAQFGNRPYKLCGEYNDCCDVLNKIWNKISECEGNDENS